MRGMHHMGNRGIQPPPPGMNRNLCNGNPPSGVIDDPLAAFKRMLREKDERDRRLGKHRRRSRSRSICRSYSRSRSRSFSRRSPLNRISRSGSPAIKRRFCRSPMSFGQRSRTPKRRSRSGIFSISRSRSYSRSQSPRDSLLSRDRDRYRDRDSDSDNDRELFSRYKSPNQYPLRFERHRVRPESQEFREAYNNYYNNSSNEFVDRDRERDLNHF